MCSTLYEIGKAAYTAAFFPHRAYQHHMPVALHRGPHSSIKGFGAGPTSYNILSATTPLHLCKHVLRTLCHWYIRFPCCFYRPCTHISSLKAFATRVLPRVCGLSGPSVWYRCRHLLCRLVQAPHRRLVVSRPMLPPLPEITPRTRSYCTSLMPSV